MLLSGPVARGLLEHRPRLGAVYSPALRIAQAALGCRASSLGSLGQLWRRHMGLHRCPRLRPALALHCPAADRRRMRSRGQPPGWSLRPHLGRSAGRIRSKWRWNLQTPETMGREKCTAGSRHHSTSTTCLRVWRFGWDGNYLKAQFIQTDPLQILLKRC